jgi:hypothetical protein
LERQHSVPILLSATSGGSERLKLVAREGDNTVSEAYIQALVHEHPACLPIAEIDPMFADPVAICTELNTLAGPIDNFMVTPSGLPILVECKLWRSPEARREVVGQILDYAKELSRWSSSDVQREVSHRLKQAPRFSRFAALAINPFSTMSPACSRFVAKARISASRQLSSSSSTSGSSAVRRPNPTFCKNSESSQCPAVPHPFRSLITGIPKTR